MAKWRQAALRWTRDIIACAVWSYIIIKLFVFDIDSYLVQQLAPSLEWVIKLKSLFLLMTLAFLLSLYKWPKIQLMALYILTFPVVLLLWKLPIAAFTRWPVTLACAPAIYDIATAFRPTIIGYTLAIASAVLIIDSDNRPLIITAMVILGVFLIWHVWKSLLKAYRSTVFSGLSRLLGKLRSRIEGGVILGRGKAGQASPNSKGESLVLYSLNNVFSIIHNKVREAAGTKRIDLYLLTTWCYTIVLIIIVYGFEYYGLYKYNPSSFFIDPKAFAGRDPNFWSFLGYSFNAFMTAGISKISAESNLANVLSYTELGAFLVSVIMLFFIGLTAARDRYLKDTEQFIEELRLTTIAASEAMQRECNMSLEEAETLLVEEHEAIINGLRAFKGQPALIRTPAAASVETPQGSPAAAEQTDTVRPAVNGELLD